MSEDKERLQQNFLQFVQSLEKTEPAAARQLYDVMGLVQEHLRKNSQEGRLDVLQKPQSAEISSLRQKAQPEPDNNTRTQEIGTFFQSVASLPAVTKEIGKFLRSADGSSNISQEVNKFMDSIDKALLVSSDEEFYKAHEDKGNDTDKDATVKSSAPDKSYFFSFENKVALKEVAELFPKLPDRVKQTSHGSTLGQAWQRRRFFKNMMLWGAVLLTGGACLYGIIMLAHHQALSSTDKAGPTSNPNQPVADDKEKPVNSSNTIVLPSTKSVAKPEVLAIPQTAPDKATLPPLAPPVSPLPGSDNIGKEISDQAKDMPDLQKLLTAGVYTGEQVAGAVQGLWQSDMLRREDIPTLNQIYDKYSENSILANSLIVPLGNWGGEESRSLLTKILMNPVADKVEAGKALWKFSDGKSRKIILQAFQMETAPRVCLAWVNFLSNAAPADKEIHDNLLAKFYSVSDEELQGNILSALATMKITQPQLFLRFLVNPEYSNSLRMRAADAMMAQCASEQDSIKTTSDLLFELSKAVVTTEDPALRQKIQDVLHLLSR